MREKTQTDWSPVPSINSALVGRDFFPRLLLILAIPVLLGSLLQACGGSGGAPAPSNIASITIDPVNPAIAVGTTVQLHATANFKNKTTKDITESATWVSADTTVANVSSVPSTKGLSSGSGVGATTVIVKFKGKKGTSTFTVTQVTLKSITVAPAEPVIIKGTTVQLSAFGQFSNGSTQDLTTQVSWTSGSNGIALVSDASPTKGLVTGVAAGNTPVTASLNGIQGSSMVTVTAATLTSITVTPANPAISKGTEVQLIATCNLSSGITLDCTSLVAWTSADNSIASVSTASGTQGLVTGLGAGSTSITAAHGVVSGSTTVSVTDATLTSITVTPINPSIAKLTMVQLIATGTFSDGSTQDLTTQVSWTSADEAIAQVSNINTPGVVTGLEVGSTSITATLSGVSGSTTDTVTAATLTSIEITPPNPSIAKGTSIQLSAIGTFSDGTTQDLTSQVSATSSNPGIVVPNPSAAKGLVTGTVVGSTVITATLNGIQGSTTVTVTSAVLTSITITPPNPSIAKGTSIQLFAIGTFSDGTTQDLTSQVSGTSSNPGIVVPNPSVAKGLVTGTAVGSTVITATLNGIQGSTTVTVTSAVLTSITITPPNPSIAKGTTVQLIATGNYTDGSTQDLTSQVSWTSGDNTIAQVSGALGTIGLVTGLNMGSTSIAATLNGISGSTTVMVTVPTLVSIIVTPANQTVSAGTTLMMTATAVFSDGTMQNVTAQADWTSSDENVAHIISSGSPNTNGRLMAKKPGTTTITATIPSLGNAHGSTVVTVT